MSSIKFADAVIALAAAFQAATATTLAGVTVTSSPAPANANAGDFIIVGHDGSLESDGSLSELANTGDFTQNFVALPSVTADAGHALQEEQGTINCVAVSQTGDTADLAGRMTAAANIAAACDDISLDLKSGTIIFDSANTGVMTTRQSGQGCGALLFFTVSYSAPW